ncbi:hypothetical protein [Paenibacillus sp. RC67]|uniref:hypothetical protein n=1 Tax=Paenibacillus sp. RC67 TaxID=3039392 RepID=UPI0024AD37EC|nr:hypothetical protein [Paenibacillus sp. RC67]
MSDFKVIFDLQNGTEGVTYKKGDDGIPIFLDTDETKRIMYNYLDYSMLINGKDMGDPDFDKLYDDMVAEYMKIGGKEVQDEMLKAYQDMKKK